jgi:hypothetical protein
LGFREDEVMRRNAAKLWLMTQALRYLWAEIRAGHWSKYGFSYHQFLANELVAGRYSPEQRRLAALFVKRIATKQEDAQSVRIAQWVLEESSGSPRAESTSI